MDSVGGYYPAPLALLYTMGHTTQQSLLLSWYPAIVGKSQQFIWRLSTRRCHSLTHWGRVMHICISKLAIISSDNGLSPGRRQAIIWTNAGILLIGSLGTNFSEILIEIQVFSFNKMHLNITSVKWRPFCLSLNVLLNGLCWLHLNIDHQDNSCSYRCYSDSMLLLLIPALPVRLWETMLTRTVATWLLLKWYCVIQSSDCRLVKCLISVHPMTCSYPTWWVLGYRNWPRYGLCCRAWYSYPAQHKLCQVTRGHLWPRCLAQRELCQIAVPTMTVQTV